MPARERYSSVPFPSYFEDTQSGERLHESSTGIHGHCGWAGHMNIRNESFKIKIIQDLFMLPTCQALYKVLFI